MPAASDILPTPVIAEIDFEKPGKQFGVLRVPQSRKDSGWGTISLTSQTIGPGGVGLEPGPRRAVRG